MLSATPTAVRNAVFDAVHRYVRRQLDGWDSTWRGMVINQMERPTGRALILKAYASGRTIRRLPRRNDG
jgi:hypothetical protein